MIYMDFCKGGSLADFISRRQRGSEGPVSESYICRVFYQLSAALLYCHHGTVIGPNGSGTVPFDWKPVLHRDIKPGNILLSTDKETEDVVVKLGDFGLSAFLDEDKAPSTYAGTKEYLAPEISRSRRGANHWTKMCDIFSLGCTIHELARLKPPFVGHMEEGDTIEPLPDHYSSKLSNRVVTCMAYYPDRRDDATDLVRKMRSFRPDPSRLQTPAPVLPKYSAPSSQAADQPSEGRVFGRQTTTSRPTAVDPVPPQSFDNKQLQSQPESVKYPHRRSGQKDEISPESSQLKENQYSFPSRSSRSSLHGPKPLETVEDAIKRLIDPALKELGMDQTIPANRAKFKEDHYSFRSGSSRASLSDPKLLGTVEGATKRLILPELKEPKNVQKIEANRAGFDRDTTLSQASESIASKDNLSPPSQAQYPAPEANGLLSQSPLLARLTRYECLARLVPFSTVCSSSSTF
jgi:serine/threonine protein kinase